LVAGAVYLVTAAPWGLERVWDQSFRYHSDARRLNSRPSAAWKVVVTLWERDPLVVLALAAAVVTVLLAWAGVGRRVERVSEVRTQPPIGVVVAVISGWALLVFAILLWEPALFVPHVSQIVVPLALLASLRPPPWPFLAAALLIATPFWVAENDSIIW